MRLVLFGAWFLVMVVGGVWGQSAGPFRGAGRELEPGQNVAGQSDEPSGVLRVVFHVNLGDVDAQKRALKNVENFLREEPTAEVEVVCHGPGIGVVVADRCPDSDRLAALMGRGVRFVGCQNTLREQNIPRERLLPGVETVASGAAEVIRKQRAGFAYFKP